MGTYLTEEEFIKRCKAIHSNKFDYSLVEYTGVKGKVKIKCPVHGFFKQQAGGHLQGKGCRKCSKLKSNFEINGNPPRD